MTAQTPLQALLARIDDPNKHLSALHGLEGKTVVYAAYPWGPDFRRVDSVIVASDGSWIEIAAESTGPDESVVRYGGWKSQGNELSRLLAPEELATAGIIQQAEIGLLVERNAQLELEADQKKLEAGIDALEQIAKSRGIDMGSAIEALRKSSGLGGTP